MKYLFLIISLACIALSGLYTLVIAPSQTIRIPDDWSFEAEYLGDLVYIDPEQNIPDTATVNVYRRSMRVVEWEPAQAVIEDVFETRDVYSGQVTWSTTLRFNVNPEDGTIISHPGRPEATGMQYVLPRQTKKTDYEFFNYTLWPVTLNFEREDSLGGLDVYVFTYKGLIDFTELTRKAEYAGEMEELPENIKIQSFDYYLELWVEPRTGEVVHMVDIDPGDYWVDGETGKKIFLAAIWSGATTGNTDLTLVERVKTHLFLLDVHHRWIPGVLFWIGCALLGVHAYLHFGLKKQLYQEGA